jgi:hypothetical protein
MQIKPDAFQSDVVQPLYNHGVLINFVVKKILCMQAQYYCKTWTGLIYFTINAALNLPWFAVVLSRADQRVGLCHMRSIRQMS